MEYPYDFNASKYPKTVVIMTSKLSLALVSKRKSCLVKLRLSSVDDSGVLLSSKIIFFSRISFKVT